MSALLDTPFFQRLNFWLVLAWAALALYWLGRVALQARRYGRRPAVSWWAVPGLLLLALAPLTENEALFGLGAGALLLGEWHPGAFLRARQRPVWAWGIGLGLLGAAALGARPVTFLSLILGLGLSLWGLGALAAALFWRGLRPTQGRLLPRRDTWVPGARWQAAVRPAVPELSLTLGERAAALRNDAPHAVQLRGWAPVYPQSLNSFYPLDLLLPPGAEVALPRLGQQCGLCVWYRVPQEVRLFRADWVEPPAGARWLN